MGDVTNFIMRTVFGKMPTCHNCGLQMPHDGQEVLEANRGWTEVTPYLECRACGCGDIRYEPIKTPMPER